MARLESQAKMGYYPTPEVVVGMIADYIKGDKISILDPCCGEGIALSILEEKLGASVYGIELDAERAKAAKALLGEGNVVNDSVYDAVIRPVKSFSVLYLNPPYDYEDGERMEYLFLKHSIKWLKESGLLVYIVPYYVFHQKKVRDFISDNFREINVVQFPEELYPIYKQVILFGVKEEKAESPFPIHYPDIDKTASAEYVVPKGAKLDVFESGGMKDEEILQYDSLKDIRTVLGVSEKNNNHTTPLFPLRKGHMLSYLASGALDGKIGNIVVKCFTDRLRSIRQDEENNKEITQDSYTTCIRVVEKGRWYDVR